MNKRLYLRFKHKVKHVKGDETKLEPEFVEERVTIKAHYAFIARSQVKFSKNAKKRYKMKRSAYISSIMGDGESCSVEVSSQEKLKCRHDASSQSSSVIDLTCDEFVDISKQNESTTSSFNDRPGDFRKWEFMKTKSKNNPHDASSQSSTITQDLTCDQFDAVSKQNECTTSSFSESVVLPIDFRKWEYVKTKSKKNLPHDGLPIKVLSYNVLAQCLLENHPYLYRKCPPNVLRWEYRTAVLYKEICEIDPDIICLQEVQESHLESFYGKFVELGYEGIYKQRTGIRQDGCAIYFKSSLFELLEQSNVEFYQPELKLLNRDNIGLMVKLSPRSMKSTPFVVATTHLLYNPRRTDVRLAQMQVFLAEIDRFSYSEVGSNNRRGTHLPIIMTGDLNSAPSSPVYSLVTKGEIGCINRDTNTWMQIAVTDQCQHLGIYINRKSGLCSTNSNLTKLHNSEKKRAHMFERQEVFSADRFINYDHLFNSGNIVHFLDFKSVYNHTNDNNDNEATTFQDFWITVDYIFYSAKNVSGELILLERLRLPTEDECRILKYLPNNVYGSDHLALAAKFLLRPLCTT